MPPMTATEPDPVHTARRAPTSWVLEAPAVDPASAAAHFAAKLAVETDPSDVHADLESGVGGFRVVDARGADAYAAGHLPGAIHLPYRTISAETAAGLDADDVVVTYCWGPHCNSAERAAVRLAALGFRVKLMVGGVWGWEQDGYPLVGG